MQAERRPLKKRIIIRRHVAGWLLGRAAKAVGAYLACASVHCLHVHGLRRAARRSRARRPLQPWPLPEAETGSSRRGRRRADRGLHLLRPAGCGKRQWRRRLRGERRMFNVVQKAWTERGHKKWFVWFCLEVVFEVDGATAPPINQSGRTRRCVKQRRKEAILTPSRRRRRI